jgi:GDPmannose 4,6-dehydratase
MWLMLQQPQPDDYVIATGEPHSVREFCETAFGYLGLDYRNHVVKDKRYCPPTEVELLVGDASKARAAFGWQPRTNFAELVKMMVEADVELLKKQHCV